MTRTFFPWPVALSDMEGCRLVKDFFIYAKPLDEAIPTSDIIQKSSIEGFHDGIGNVLY